MLNWGRKGKALAEYKQIYVTEIWSSFKILFCGRTHDTAYPFLILGDGEIRIIW